MKNKQVHFKEVTKRKKSKKMCLKIAFYTEFRYLNKNMVSTNLQVISDFMITSKDFTLRFSKCH